MLWDISTAAPTRQAARRPAWSSSPAISSNTAPRTAKTIENSEMMSGLIRARPNRAASAPAQAFDLIYARSPHQTPDLWRAELELAISHAAEHLSLYQLTIEPDTMFERLFKAGKLAVPDHEAGAALYEITAQPSMACRSMRSPITPAPARNA
eukprot:gene65533-89650_t